MYIQTIQIENVRCFENVDLDLTRPDGSPLAGWTVLAGRNGSGKSTFLKAIALAAVGYNRAQALDVGFATWSRDGQAKGFVHIELDEESTLSDLRFGWVLPRSNVSPQMASVAVPATIVPDVLKEFGDTILNTSDEKAAEVRAWISQYLAPQKQLWEGISGSLKLIAYGPYRRLSGHATDAERLMSGPAEIARVVSLFREDASLVESVTWLREVYLRRLEKNDKDAKLEKAVLALLDDGLLPDGAKVVRIDSDGLWVHQNGVPLTLRELSDGYRTVAALVLDIVRHLHGAYDELEIRKVEGLEGANLQILNPAVVLIDEVDLHLHVRWQQRIGFWLKRHFPNIQFIVTTHSPFICQAADPGGLIRLPMPGEGRQVEKVSEELFYTVVNGSIDEAVLSELFGIESLYSDETDRLRDQVAALESKVILGTATPEEMDELQHLRGKLPRSMSSDVELKMRSLRDLE